MELKEISALVEKAELSDIEATTKRRLMREVPTKVTYVIWREDGFNLNDVTNYFFF